MKPLLLLALSAATAAEPVVIQRRDIVGTWSDTACAKYKGELELREDGSFLWSCTDQVDGGKWVFHPPSKLEFISWSDSVKGTVSKDSERRIIRIEAFARHRMIFLLERGERDILLKQ